MNKVLVLGAVTCVAGIVTAGAAGCSSSETTVVQNDAGAGDARPDRIIPDSGGEEDDAGACPIPPNPADPLTAAVLDERRGWKPALAAPGSCTNAEITTFEKNLDDDNIKTWWDIATGLSAECAKCTVGKDTDTNWPPIIGTEESSGERGFYNFGACYGHVEGAACGKALQYEQFCYNIACGGCTTTQAERQDCVNQAGSEGGICEPFVKEMLAQCKDRVNTSKKCSNIVNGAKVLCGTPGDGGIVDAGEDADAGQ